MSLARFPVGVARVRPRPLRGVPLVGSTGLRLLVAANPPFLLDVDSGSRKPIGGLQLRGKPVLSVLAVGKDAVLWLDRRGPANALPAAEIYVVRRGTPTARRIATGWGVAPSADGQAIWLKSFTDADSCELREVALDGRERQSPRPVPCSTELVGGPAGTLLVEGSSVLDPSTGQTLLPIGGLWAVVGRFALTTAASHGPLTLTDLPSGEQWRLRWPSQTGSAPQGGRNRAAVQADAKLVALSFSDPAFEFSGTQVTDIWLLDPSTRRFRHLPDMPAALSLKFTSMAWTSDGRLVLLARTAERDVVAVWRPGQTRIRVRPVRLPAARDSSFVVWDGARSP